MLLGCGDVGLRFIRAFGSRLRVFGVVRRQDATAGIRQAGAVPILVDLDDRITSRRLRGLAARVLHSAPPPQDGLDDARTRHALAALPAARRWVYLSTTGVYGDCGGAWVDETRTVAPHNDRAIRRVAAERQLRRHAARGTAQVVVLRVPGIYAHDRLPVERLQRGTPALQSQDDGYTNHIQADDLASIAFTALWRGGASRVIHAVDDSALKMGDYFDAVADAFDLPRAPRLPREALKAAVSPMLWSFISESRRLRNDRLKRELRVRLRYPTVAALLARVRPRASASPDMSATSA